MSLNFVTCDYEKTNISVETIKHALAFKEAHPDLDEWQYRNFYVFREQINEAFADPYGIEEIDDEIGKGFKSSITVHQWLDNAVLKLLEEFALSQGFVKLVILDGGSGRSHLTCKDSTGGTFILERNKWVGYKIKLYTELK